MELISRARNFASHIAVIDGVRQFTYSELLEASENCAHALLRGRGHLKGARIAFMVPPGFDYVAVQWGIWRAGGIAVPLALSYPVPELEYVIETVACEAVIAHPDHEVLISSLSKQFDLHFWGTNDFPSLRSPKLPEVSPSQGAMILFTSGTTSRPKGVVISHANVEAQMRALTEAWAWEQKDHILNVLPLHHVHGITNVLCCALWSGAICEFMSRFDAEKVWKRFSSGELSLFMAVPTIYAKLIRYWEGLDSNEQKRLQKASTNFRLMVSGSAALPVSVLEKWERITGQRLLERYGMTEIGMGLSNPYGSERRAGHVGQALPNVEIRLVTAEMNDVNAGDSGEILVRGPGVFSEYWDRPEATENAFVDGWFRTGDIAVIQNGYCRILGRSSVDILKSGGYKISALEIEEVFRQHSGIVDCAAVGMPDEEWGEIIAMAAKASGPAVESELLINWAKDRLAPYKLPRRIIFVEDLPRNAIGKVMKAKVKDLFS